MKNENLLTLPKDYEDFEVSSATLKTNDIINNIRYFISSVENLLNANIINEFNKLFNEYESIAIFVDIDNIDTQDLILSELFDLMQEIAPGNCSFESHTGDGASFGFWLNNDDY